MVVTPRSTEANVNILEKVNVLRTVNENTVANLAEPFVSCRSERNCGKIAVNHVIVPPVAMYLSCFLVCSTIELLFRGSELGLVLMCSSE